MFNWLSKFVGGGRREHWLNRVLRSKSDDPRNSGGWNILAGAMSTWKNANEIWQSKAVAEQEGTYGAQVTVYACVKRICISAQEAPLRIARKTKEGWKDIENHFMSPLLKRPNNEMHYAEFLWHVVSHLELTGKSYVWKWRAATGEPVEMWPVPSSWVLPIRDGSGLKGYSVWQGEGKPRQLVLPEDMTRTIYPDPCNLTDGLGPLQAAMRDVQTDEERADYIIEMLTNTRSPGLILTQPEGWTPDQKDEVRALLNSGLGRGRRGRTLFLEGEGAKIDQAAPLKDLDWPGMSALSETRICAAFGVPPIIIGLRSGLQNATYSNYEQAEKSFYQGSMVPRWKMLDAAFTRGFLRDEGETDDSVECYHDTSDVRALREDEDKNAERANKIFSSGLGTRNEGRERVGLPPLPPDIGEVYLLPMNAVEVPVNPAARQDDKPPKDDGTDKEA